MTIIVYRSGVLAADAAVYAGDRQSGTTTKIVRGKHGGIAGAAGTHATCQAFLQWFERGMPAGKFTPPDDGDLGFGALMVDATGAVTRMNRHGIIYQAPEADYHIEGSGEDVAAGALEHGATAEEAVEIAIRLHPFCGGPIVVERLAVAESEAA